MPILSTTCDWIDLQPGLTYRKTELYAMEWATDTDLSQMNVVAASYGGPMAIVRDAKEFVKVGGSSGKPVIRMFTGSGHLISTLNWNSGKLLVLGWSDAEELLCVQNDGLVLIYNMFAQYQHTFSMGQEAKDTKVIDAKIFASKSGTGVAVMTSNFRIILVNSIQYPRERHLPEMPKSISNPTCWAIMNEERNTCCLVAREKEIFKLRQGDSICTALSVSIENEFGSIILMSVSYNHRFLALYTNNGILWMGTSDMKTKYCEFKTNQTDRPKQIEWIMDSDNGLQSSAVVVAYPSLLLVVTVAGDSNMYVYDSIPFLIPEMDCVRIISDNDHELLQRVPSCMHNIFAINSQKPSSYLYGAFQKYEEKSHQSDEYLGLIKDKMEESVDECIEAARYEFDTTVQKNLIRAAYFGKAFIIGHDPNKYIETCRVLRVLNTLRDPKIGMPFTYSQFNHLKPNVILDRLVFRKQYGLAIQIAKHLKLPESRILEHWAFHKVTHDKNDDDVARKISDKMKSSGAQGISFCNIAKKAQKEGRNNLAIKLLELEPKPSLQVPLLLTLGENKRALTSATKSGDTDLIYTVLLQLKESSQLADFLMIIRTFPTAQSLYKKYCQLNSKTALQEIFNQEDDFVAQAEFALKDGIENSTIETTLLTASVAYKKAHKDTEAEICEDARKLLKDQKSFAEKYSEPRFYGASVHETIKKLLILGDIKSAEKKKAEYKMPDKRYWWIRIQVLSERFQWEEMEKFSKSKKSPIGYEPFVEVCLKQHNVEQAKKYLSKCQNNKRAKWYLRAGLPEEAAQAYFDQRDLDGLYKVHHIVKNNNDRVLATRVEGFIERLSEKR